MSKALERTVTVENKQGIHMRPATALINLANQYESTVEICSADRSVNGKSIMELLTLGAAKGTVLTLRVEGDDAGEAITAIEALIRGGFGE